MASPTFGTIIKNFPDLPLWKKKKVNSKGKNISYTLLEMSDKSGDEFPAEGLAGLEMAVADEDIVHAGAGNLGDDYRVLESLGIDLVGKSNDLSGIDRVFIPNAGNVDFPDFIRTPVASVAVVVLLVVFTGPVRVDEGDGDIDGGCVLDSMEDQFVNFISGLDPLLDVSLVSQAKVDAVIVEIGADIGLDAGGFNQVPGNLGGGVEKDVFGLVPVGVVGYADDPLIEHVGRFLGDGVVDDDLVKEHGVGDEDVASDGLFAPDTSADLVENHIHGSEFLDVAGQVETGKLDAVTGSIGAFEGDKGPGGQAADWGLERPPEEHPAEEAKQGAEPPEDAVAVGDDQEGGEASDQPVQPGDHGAFDRGLLSAGEEALSKDGKKTRGRHDGRDHADQPGQAQSTR